MIHKFSKWVLGLLMAAFLPLSAPAQQQVQQQQQQDQKQQLKQQQPQESGYKFTLDKQLPCSPVKRQIGSTCWCYATMSFLESEVIRTQGKVLDLSEMYNVQYILTEKSSNYVRLAGKTAIADGGLGHHVTNTWRAVGLAPEEACKHVSHMKIFAELKKTLDEQVKTRKGWTPEIAAQVKTAIENMLGTLPEKFTFESKEYTPVTFAKEVVKLNPDDYIELTSYTHHPFYQKIRLEIPDNWDFEGNFYNVPLDELEKIVDNALANGYTVVWDGDVSEKTYSESKGVALIPVEGPDGQKSPAVEQKITQQLRQDAFDTFATTDDHVMHIAGVAHDQNNNKFYYVKNSHGLNGPYAGYLYMSLPYFRLKTVSLVVHKNSVPADVARKLSLTPSK